MMGARTARHRARYHALADRASRLLRDRRDPRQWIEANLQIRSKDKRIIPFHFNAVQIEYYAQRSLRDIILKSRQVGITTEVSGLFLADTLLCPNTTSVMVAHDLESTVRIFRIVQLCWERLPDEIKRAVGPPSRSNRREFLWPRINSHLFVGTAGSLTFGRGQTINNLHASELAFWPKPEEACVSLTEAVPRAGGRIIVESTANGVGNFFHDLWTGAKEGRNGFRPHVFLWWQDQVNRIPGPPLDDMTKEGVALAKSFHLHHDQIRWRRDATRRLGSLFPQEYPENDMTCFLTSGRMVFDADALQRQASWIAEEPGPKRVGTVTLKGQKYPVAPATLLVWYYLEKGSRYVIGADVGEGLEGGDASCAVVLEWETGVQVAELHGRIPPDRFARLLNVLGRYYNNADLAVERNNHGHTVLSLLRNDLGYPDLYYHLRYDARRRRQPVLGWPTDQSTKPILVDDLAAAIASNDIIIQSPALIDECRTFVTTDTGSQEAQPGKHDDRVIAAGIAWQARKRGVARGHRRRPEGW